MPPQSHTITASRDCLDEAVKLSINKILNRQVCNNTNFRPANPVLVMLAAGKGTRFGKHPKCAQLVGNIPLAMHSLTAYRQVSPAPCVCVVGYQADEVSRSLGTENIYCLSDNPTGGTAYAAFEAFSVPGLVESNPVVVISMGDRIVTEGVFQDLLDTHHRDNEADLTMLTAIYQPPKNQGKGRIVRDEHGQIVRIVEQRDIESMPTRTERDHLLAQTEGNCPLYAIRAATLKRYLARVDKGNAQGQYYFTDIVEAISRDGGTVRNIIRRPNDADYDLLCADVTRPQDIPHLEETLRRHQSRRSSQ